MNQYITLLLLLLLLPLELPSLSLSATIVNINININISISTSYIPDHQISVDIVFWIAILYNNKNYYIISLYEEDEGSITNSSQDFQCGVTDGR